MWACEYGFVGSTSKHSSTYISRVKRYFSTSNQPINTRDCLVPSLPGAMLVDHCLVFFDGGTYFGNNAAKIRAGEPVFGNVNAASHSLSVGTKCQRNQR